MLSMPSALPAATPPACGPRYFPQQPHTLCTARLRLRPWQPDDWPAFAALCADPQVMAHFPTTLSPAQSDALADHIALRVVRWGWWFWAAELLATRRFIGFIGLNIPAQALPFTTAQATCVEVGWRLAVPYWGQGLATEGARAALAFAQHTLALREVVSFTPHSNARSQAVMQRLGMQRDAQGFGHPALAPDHRLHPHVLYRTRWQ